MQTDQHTGPHRVELSHWISCSPFEQLLGMHIVEAAQGRALLEMPFSRSLAQGVGLMHGGALVSLADAAVVMAIKSLLTPGTQFVTTDMQIRFLRPVKQGIVQARAVIDQHEADHLKGRCEVLNEDGRAVIAATTMFKILVETKVR